MYNKTQSCPFPSTVPPQTTITISTPLTDPVFTRIDSLNNAVAALQQQHQNILTNADKGQTQLLLDAIMASPPSGQLKNMLMADSPLSDTVLIAFMTHSINKPAQKKEVVLANSPLPIRVRPYIDQMNINQNFKNQLWAAQNGQPNARTQMENLIKWLDDYRMQTVSDLITSTTYDSLGYKTDSIIAYLANSNMVEDRIARCNLFFKKADYTQAQSELGVINTLVTGLPVEKQPLFDDYVSTSDILLQTLQLPDSIADSLIIMNQPYLESVASSEFVYAQSTAKSLLEKAGIPQEYNVWLPDGSVAKSLSLSANTSHYDSETCNKLVISPNPSDGNIKISYQLEDGETGGEIRLTASDGKVMNSYQVTGEKGEIRINCNTCISGNYILSLYINGELHCSKAVSIKK